ncbi:chemotaxis response regulator protein-glutamate methylesterase [Halobacteriales archaeon SW_10_66_29]|nr:MAG: chemotaxis response regulator protein-glutamate methylesterase [Halobacteriales archaeon SW_10_66_29]
MVDAVVVDDSQFMRIQIRGMLEERGLTVVGEAGNGKRAVETVLDCEPDVVTMDVKMPGMGGIEAVERIMAERPTPILMLSRYTEAGAETSLEALSAGAVEFFHKPDGEVSPSLVQYADDLVETVRVVADADVTARVGTTARDGAASFPELAAESAAESSPTAVPEVGTPSTVSPTLVIAASTGGPPTVESILSALPGTAGLRVLVVQHMPEQFTGRFAERLDEHCELAVRESAPNDRLGPDEAVVANGEYHTEVADGSGEMLALSLTEEPPVHSVRPAADVTLGSVADAVSGPLLAVVLSGMGRDGAAGLERIAEAGGTTIAQDPEEARISSMPERAIETGVVDHVLPAADIPECILTSVREMA